MQRLLITLAILLAISSTNSQWTQNCTLLGLSNCQTCQTTYFSNTAICSSCATGFACKPSSTSVYQSGPYASGYGGYASGYSNMSSTSGSGSCDCIPCQADCQRCTICQQFDMSCQAGTTKCSQCSLGFYPNFAGNCVNSTTTPFIFTKEQINKIIAVHGK